MKQFRIVAVVLLACAPLSCQKNGSPVPDLPQIEKPHSGPIIEIKGQSELTFNPGIKFTVWNLRASRVQELSARLLVISDGKAAVAQQAVYTWDKWPEGKPDAVWQLYYLLMDGEPFGSNNKRLRVVSLKFDDTPPGRTSTQNSSLFVEGIFGIQDSESRNQNSVVPGRAEIIYSAFYDPTKGGSSHAFSDTVDSLVDASKGGRTVVAVVLEWKPFADSK